jgi:hypothetical protein
MKLSAVILARFFGFIETSDLNPRGRAYFPELASALVERYGFAKFPQKPEEFDESKGVTFESGRSGEATIHRVVIHDHAIYLDTASSTDDSERIFHESLTWLSHDLGLIYRPEMVRRKTYVSQLTFYSDVMLDKLHPALTKLAQRLTTRVPQYYGQPLDYTPSNVLVGYDPLTVKAGPAPFAIERRADTLYTEKKYFSSAPLPTNEHIGLLEAFEADVLAFGSHGT